MELLHIVVLALLQGLTEFLPISSSAHLILVPILTGWPDQGLAFDVAVHVGTLLAVLIYFRHDVVTLLQAWLKSLRGIHSAEARLAWAIVIGTIPVGLVGLFGREFIEHSLRSPAVIAATTIIFAVLLWASDRWRSETHDEMKISWREVLIIGVAQAVALIPGVSRSGITMTAGLFVGLTRTAAARFSFLLSLPVIALAGGLETKSLVESALPVDWQALLIGAALSFASALACIHWFMTWLPRIGMLPFVIYRLLLGVVLVWVFVV